jgi:hypothetical protein
MNEEQESLAEKIINIHKEKDGLLEWDSVYDRIDLLSNEWSDRKKSDQLTFIQAILADLGLIFFLDEEGNLSRLTRKGNAFTSFKMVKEKEEELDILNRLSTEKLQLEVAELQQRMSNFENTQKQNSRLVIFAALTAFAAIATVIITLLK